MAVLVLAEPTGMGDRGCGSVLALTEPTGMSNLGSELLHTSFQ